MNRVRIGVGLSLSLAFAGVLFACSSSNGQSSGSSPGSSGSSGQGTASSSSSSSSGSSGDACEIPPATYTIHYTKAAGSAPACTDLPDQTVNVQVSDASTSDGSGNGCTQTEDKSTCTFHLSCTQAAAGATTKSESDIKNDSGNVTGTNHITVTDGSGNVTYDCTYDFVYKKD
jgi:hypothetical protein